MKTRTDIKFEGKTTTHHADGCISIAFFRPTDSSNAVSINGFPLEAGQTLSIAQNIGDFDISDYHIVFTAGVGSNLLFIIKTMPVEGKQR